MAGDRRATAGYTIASRRIEKVFPADDLSGVAIAGAAGPAVEMVRLFQVQLEHYEKIEGETLSLEGKANQLGADGARQPPGRHAGLRGGAALRRVRPPPRPRPGVQLRRHRRQVRGGRLPDQRLRRRARPQLDQGHLAGGHDPRRHRRPRAPLAVRRGRRGHRHRRPRPRPADLPDGRGDRRRPGTSALDDAGRRTRPRRSTAAAKKGAGCEHALLRPARSR